MEKEKKKKKRRIFAIAALSVFSIVLVCASWCFIKLNQKYNGEDVRLYIPHGASNQSIADTLSLHLGNEFGGTVYDILSLKRKSAPAAEGSYLVKKGMSAIDASRKLHTGAQDPIKLTFNNVRTLDQLASRIDARMEFKADEFLAACDSILSAQGLTKQEYPAAFIPDTYEFYWNASPESVVKSLYSYHNRFWNDDRKSKAKKLGLSPEQIATIASIVEEETVKADERPKVARLYLNRLKRGMKLQADPTVKFAIGDFTIRRISGAHLNVDSPYNTYKYDGLPPGPIRIPDARTIDGVLSAPEHSFLYMCAKDDFSGYHNFAVTHEEHIANARRYHKALNIRGIK